MPKTKEPEKKKLEKEALMLLDSLILELDAAETEAVAKYDKHHAMYGGHSETHFLAGKSAGLRKAIEIIKQRKV